MKRYFGREIIYTSETLINASNVLDVLSRAIRVHQKNAAEIQYLYNYYRGMQPILNREKVVRPEINNKVVENHAREIVDFKRGYVFGEPVQYVRRGDGDGVSDSIARLNEYMFSEDKAAKDAELAEWFYICGTAYRMALPKVNLGADGESCPFEMDVLDPRSTFVVYNNGFGKKPVMGVTVIKNKDDDEVYTVYTPNEWFTIISDQIVNGGPHALGGIPIIEYPANNTRLGAFEPVLDMLDAINLVTSNRLDGIEQFVQAFMKFVNCDIDEAEFRALKELGAIKIKGEPGNPADVSLVTSELDQSQAQLTKEDLYQMVLIICGMPDRNGVGRSTGDTGQAVMLRDGWSAAEARAKDSEMIFKRSEKQFLKIVLHIIRETRGLDIQINDIDIKFTRNKTDNLLVKTQGLQNMLEAGIHPLIAITHSGLFSDPEQTFLDSSEYLEKWKEAVVNATPANNKPNNPTGGESA